MILILALIGISVFILFFQQTLAQNPDYPNVNTSAAHVNELASCTEYLVQYSCETNGCPALDPSQDIVPKCQLAASNAVYIDPCTVSLSDDWILGKIYQTIYFKTTSTMLRLCLLCCFH